MTRTLSNNSGPFQYSRGADPIIPQDLRKKPRRPVNSNLERQLFSALNDGIGSAG